MLTYPSVSEVEFVAASLRATKFLSKVQRSENPPYCWLWTGTTMRDRYGNPSYGSVHVDTGFSTTAQRAALEILTRNGRVPKGMDVDHLCRTKLCVRPSHLEIVTPAENRRRQGAAVTHCPRGHEYTPENTYRSRNWAGGLGRKCRRCQRERWS